MRTSLEGVNPQKVAENRCGAKGICMDDVSFAVDHQLSRSVDTRSKVVVAKGRKGVLSRFAG